jgi:hypothetical protein
MRPLENNKTDLSYGDMQCIIHKIKNGEHDRVITYLTHNSSRFVNVEIYNGRISKFNHNNCKVVATFNLDYIDKMPDNIGTDIDIKDFIVFRVRTEVYSTNKHNRVSKIIRNRNIYKTQLLEIKEIQSDKEEFKIALEHNRHKLMHKYIILNEKSISKRVDETIKKFICAILSCK